MSPLHRRFLMLFLVAALLPAITQQAVNAAPAFSVQDQLRYNYPLPDHNLNTFYFLVFSTEGDINGASVQVREVKRADGELRSLEAVKAELRNATTVTPKGETVTLTLDPRYFSIPGEYRIVLFFSGASGTPALSTTVVINRLAADINLDELKDQTVALTRWFPLWRASGDFTFHLRESTRRVALDDLRVAGQGVYLKDTKELVSGGVAAAPLPPDPSGAANVPPGGVKPLKVSFWDLWRAGTFDTRLLVTSTSFSGEKIIPIKVTVSDFVVFPLLAIAIGVFGGYWTRRLVSVEGPKNENKFQLLRLQNEVERFRDLVSKPSSMETIGALLAQLKRAQENNETGDFAAVKAELPKIQEQLDEFRKAQLQAQEEASTTRNGLVSQVDLLEKDEPAGDERGILLSIKDRLTDVERLLRRGMVDDAQVKLENARQLLADFQARRLTNYLNLLAVELAKLSLSGDAAARGETLKSEIQTSLNGKEFDKAREKLQELKTFVETKKAEAALRARAVEEEFAAPIPDLPGALPRETVVTRIVVTTPIEERIAGTTISFAIADPEHLIDSSDQLRWFFGDVGSSITEDASNTHRYEQSGRFQVRVEIPKKNDIPAKTLSEFITIAPGEIEQARATVLQTILRNEKILSGIALVLAIISGLLFLYVGKIFGSLVDYLMAMLWGFGIDNSIKGFAAVLAKISAPEA